MLLPQINYIKKVKSTLKAWKKIVLGFSRVKKRNNLQKFGVTLLHTQSQFLNQSYRFSCVRSPSVSCCCGSLLPSQLHPGGFLSSSAAWRQGSRNSSPTHLAPPHHKHNVRVFVNITSLILLFLAPLIITGMWLMFSDLLIVCVKAARMALDNYCFTNLMAKLLLFLASVLIIFILSAVLLSSRNERVALVGVGWHAPCVCWDILRGVNVLLRPALPLLSSFFFSFICLLKPLCQLPSQTKAGNSLSCKKGKIMQTIKVWLQDWRPRL